MITITNTITIELDSKDMEVQNVTSTNSVTVPAGRQIDPKGDVRVGDRVRLVLENGDEAIITVARVDMNWIDSHSNMYLREAVHAIYLLD